MPQRILQAVVNVPKQGIEHHEQMVKWCNENINPGDMRWFGYYLGAPETTLFHFYNKEDSTAFVLKWGGNVEARDDKS